MNSSMIYETDEEATSMISCLTIQDVNNLIAATEASNVCDNPILLKDAANYLKKAIKNSDKESLIKAKKLLLHSFLGGDRILSQESFFDSVRSEKNAIYLLGK